MPVSMRLLSLSHEVVVAICQYLSGEAVLGLRETCRQLADASRVCFSTECLSTDSPFLILRLKCNDVVKKELELDLSQLCRYDQNGLRFWLSCLQIHCIDARAEDCERLLKRMLREFADISEGGAFHVVLPNCLSLEDPESLSLITYINNCPKNFTVDVKLSGDAKEYVVLGGKFVQVDLAIPERQLLMLEPDSKSALDSLNICCKESERWVYNIKHISQTLEIFTHDYLRLLRLFNIDIQLEDCSLEAAVKVHRLEISHCNVGTLDNAICCSAAELVIEETEPEAIFGNFKLSCVEFLSISCENSDIEGKPQLLDEVFAGINQLIITGPIYRTLWEQPAFLHSSITTLSLIISELDWMKALVHLELLKQLTHLTLTLKRTNTSYYDDKLQIREMAKELARRCPTLNALDFKIETPSDNCPPTIVRIKLDWTQLKQLRL